MVIREDDAEEPDAVSEYYLVANDVGAGDAQVVCQLYADGAGDVLRLEWVQLDRRRCPVVSFSHIVL